MSVDSEISIQAITPLVFESWSLKTNFEKIGNLAYSIQEGR
jgi:hypothetical protein